MKMDDPSEAKATSKSLIEDKGNWYFRTKVSYSPCEYRKVLQYLCVSIYTNQEEPDLIQGLGIPINLNFGVLVKT